MTQQRKNYDKEFKMNAVRLYEESGKKLKEVEEELGIGSGCLSHWKREFKENQESAFPGNGKMKPHDLEMSKMKREMEILRQERDILKKALGIFSQTPR